MADDEAVAFGAGAYDERPIEASVQGGGSCAIASAAVFENAW